MTEREGALTACEAALGSTTAALRQSELHLNSRLCRLAQSIQGAVNARPWLHRSLRWLLAAQPGSRTPPPTPPEATLVLHSGLFDPAWYAARNPDAPQDALAAAAHYLACTLANPGPDFDATWYLAENPDIGAENPLLHYLRVGRYRLRATSALAKDCAEAARRQALGLDLPPPRPRIAIGFGPGANMAQAARAARSAVLAVAQAGLADCMLLWPGTAAEAPSGTTALGLAAAIRQGGAAHDHMLRHAAASGASLYLAVDAEGFFAPDCLEALLRMSAAAGEAAIIGATDFPVEHPRHVDPLSFESAWTGGGCLLLPTGPVLGLGGLEPALDALAAVDLSWRAQQAGLRVLTCPNARYVTSRAAPGISDWVTPEHLLDGYRLARLWGCERVAAMIGTEIRRHGGMPEEPGPDHFGRSPGIAVWAHGFGFAPARW